MTHVSLRGLSKDLGINGKKYKLSSDQAKAILELKVRKINWLRAR